MIRAVATERPAVVRIHLSLTIVEWSGALSKHTLVLTLTTDVDRRKFRKRSVMRLNRRQWRDGRDQRSNADRRKRRFVVHRTRKLSSSRRRGV
jgi:hypothetical protein